MMTETRCRLIFDPPADGVWNMAVDEALLESAANEGVATLRFYQWSEPTLSLGYFQQYEERQSHTASRGCPCVRRHSGGGAILHDRELTYSLALPEGGLPGRSTVGLYRLVHQVLIDSLIRLAPALEDGLRMCDPGIIRLSDDENPISDSAFLCFLRRSEGDLLVVGSAEDPGDKIAGSAQRKRRGAVLQHGSVLLSRAACAPELPGVVELSGSDVEPESLARSVAEKILPLLGGEFQREGLGREEQEFVKTMTGRFASEAWIRRR